MAKDRTIWVPKNSTCVDWNINYINSPCVHNDTKTNEEGMIDSEYQCIPNPHEIMDLDSDY